MIKIWVRIPTGDVKEIFFTSYGPHFLARAMLCRKLTPVPFSTETYRAELITCHLVAEESLFILP